MQCYILLVGYCTALVWHGSYTTLALLKVGPNYWARADLEVTLLFDQQSQNIDFAFYRTGELGKRLVCSACTARLEKFRYISTE